MLDEAVEELMLVAEEAEEDSLAGGVTGSFSFGAGESLASMMDGSGSIAGGGGSASAGSGSGLAGGGSGVTGTSNGTKSSRLNRRNPEVDSFAYLEMLMESLAALGKLGYALDAVGQRV